MKFMMLVCGNDPEPDTDLETDGPGDLGVEEWVEKYDASGARVTGERLRPSSAATTVRKRGGKVLVTDGPYVESREWIAGFDILECADLDEAIAIAAQHPQARGGALELRPFWPWEG